MMNQAMPSIIDLRDVSFTYAIGTRPALSHISLAIPAGQICGVIGRAGAGKSTLCALCAGFVPNFYEGTFSGAAQIDGQNVVEQEVSALVRHVGLVGSNAFSQISGARFTVYEEIGFGLENIGLPRDEIKERIEWALNELQMNELRDRSPYALSGGQQQRLVLAATLAMRPPVLVLDEPTAQLDPPTIEKLADLLRDLSRQGTTILFAEHRLEWVASLAERIVVLDEGQLIADGPATEVLTDPILIERKIGWPRPAALAAAARKAALWPAKQALPVTLPGLVEGLRAASGPEAPTLSPPAATVPPAATSPAAQPIIAISNVRFSYPSGVEALKGVSLSIGRGERVALLGRNGAGKSTLLRHMNGLLQPSAGQVLVAGTDTRKTTVARCAPHVGIVFQDIRNQLFARTVRDELRFGPRNLGRTPAEVDQMVGRALDALGLAEFADIHPYDLPPALRRLVAVAAVAALESDVLILDEPTAGLDNASIARLTSLAEQLVAQNRTIVVVSHDIDFSFETLDRVILMKDGGIILDSRWDSLGHQGRALIADTIELPMALSAAEALNADDGSPLGQLLTRDAQSLSPMQPAR
jgi:energy-coupling factor transport system ATP-binding protein